MKPCYLSAFHFSDPPLTMLRSATCFLSHLPTPSALARPRTSYLPGLHFRKVSLPPCPPPMLQSASAPLTPSHTHKTLQHMQLRVFARRPNDESHAEVEVKDDASVAALQNAIIVNLKLDMSPNCVRLLREVEGGVPVLLDSCKKLADQGVFEGSKVVVEVTTPQVTSALFGLFSISFVTLSLLLLQSNTHTHTHTHNSPGDSLENAQGSRSHKNHPALHLSTRLSLVLGWPHPLSHAHRQGWRQIHRNCH